MPKTPGHDPGHQPGQGLAWEEYVDWLVETHGTLTAVAERLSKVRAFSEDVGSIERALRRLRKRGHLAGGMWGARCLSTFGLPGAASERAVWMGQYHSRFTDLPVPVCLDLVRLWDRPPLNESASARAWLSLAHVSCALRRADMDAAQLHLKQVKPGKDISARIETLLVEAFIASRLDRSRVPPLLDEAEAIMTGDPCLVARLVDQRAYERNKAGDHAGAEALYARLPAEGPPFALYRRASGLAYARWKLGDSKEGARLAREACEHAGDGGHLRLRAMSLSMLARIVRGKEGEAAKARALAIVAMLDDEALRLRFNR